MTDKPMPEGTDAIIEDQAVEEAAADEDAAADRAGGNDVEFAPDAELAREDPTKPAEEPKAETAAIHADEPATGGGEKPASGSGDAAGAAQGVFAQAGDLKGQAYDRVLGLAQQGKDRAADSLDNLIKLVEEAAGTIDQKVGTQYGDYARRASDAVQGLATTLREKEVDELVEDARTAIAKSPAIAIGAAAAIGFVVARLVKAGAASIAEPEPETKGKSKGGAKGKAA